MPHGQALPQGGRTTRSAQALSDSIATDLCAAGMHLNTPKALARIIKPHLDPIDEQPSKVRQYFVNSVVKGHLREKLAAKMLAEVLSIL